MRLVPIIKTVGKITGISILCLLIAGVITGIFYEKEVKQLIISELNKNLDAKISVQEFDFSVLRHFPYASFDLKKVVVEEVTEAPSKDTLLYSDRVSLLFNMLGLFSNNVAVKKILLYDGIVNIKINSEGKGNYRFWKKSENIGEPGTIDLEKIVLKNIGLVYKDVKGRKDYGLCAKNAVLSGRFTGEDFSLNTKADLFVDRIIVHGRNYVDHKPVTVNSTLSVNSKTGVYRFAESNITIEGVHFVLSGDVVDKDPSLLLDLAIKAEESDVNSFINIIPVNWSNYLTPYKSSGKFIFSSNINGPIDHNKTPEIKLKFSVRNGNISAGDAELEKLAFAGTFDNYSGKKKATLNIPSLTAYLSGHQIQASIRLDQLPDAFLTLQAKTQLDLKKLKPFIKSDTLESISGDLAMNISYAGKVRELSKLNNGLIYNINASGNIDISNVYLTLKNNPLEFKKMNGSFVLRNNDVLIKNFSGNISSSDFILNGVFKNFISFLLIPGQPGEMKAVLNSEIIDLDELLANKSQSVSNDTSYLMKFNPRLLCNLDVKISRLNFRRFSAEKIGGHVNLNRQVISGQNLQFNSMGGMVVMDANINAARRDSITMNYDARFNKVDITRLFYEMENFDQHTMTDKNVKGRVTADVQFLSTWSKDLTLNSKSVRSTGNIKIENGELINFSPIKALGKYIHTPDLNHIKFSTLQNNISIANRKIYIPHMDINSTAINISGSGTHDFDNMVDYHIRLLLSDILGKKIKNNSTEFGEIEDDGLGHTKLFVNLKGPVDNPDFSYDKKAAGEKLKNDITQEKQNLKGMFKKEFGAYKNEPSVQIPKPKKREEMQIDWSNE